MMSLEGLICISVSLLWDSHLKEMRACTETLCLKLSDFSRHFTQVIRCASITCALSELMLQINLKLKKLRLVDVLDLMTITQLPSL